MTEKSEDNNLLVELITKNQGPLYAYIVSLLYRRQDSQDVLQETNMVLWKKRDEAPKNDEFIAWACRVAYYQVLAYRKRNVRDRHFFTEQILSDLAISAATGAASHEPRVEALSGCIQRLTGRSLQLLRQRYFSSQSVTEIADEMNKSVAAVSQSLYRIRRQLLDCVHKQLTGEA